MNKLKVHESETNYSIIIDDKIVKYLEVVELGDEKSDKLCCNTKELANVMISLQ